MKINERKTPVKGTRRKSKHQQGPRETKTAREYSGDPKSLAPRLQRLAQAIAAAPSRSKSENLTHAECEALLEFYVDCENREEDARALYPTVWEHLQCCDRCKISYELLSEPPSPEDTASDLLRQSGPKTLAVLPFLAHTDKNELWITQIRSRVGGTPLGFGFIVRSAHLARVLIPSYPSGTRGEATRTERSLLLSDSVMLGKHQVTVDIWLHHPESPDTVKIDISFVPSAPLPEPIRVSLAWDGHRYSDLIRGGQCIFDRIPVSDFLARKDLRVEFETEESEDAIEVAHGDRRP